MILGINKDISNAYYHADKTAYSSSALKTILKSKEEFYKKYILREPEIVKNIGALNMGTALHTKILEPHLFDSEILVYPGAIRRGKDWDAFSAENKGKTILTLSELDKVNVMVASYEANPTAVDLVSGCEYEHTLLADYEEIRLKVRCDGINVSKGYIFDVKSTAYGSGVDIFKETVSGLSYDLSGYMYAKIASMVYGQKFDFYFVVCSKADNLCKVYRMSSATMAEGRKQFSYAIDTLKKSLLTGDWSDDSLEIDEVTNQIEEV
jgi:exodeoxyribonuclease VIII